MKDNLSITGSEIINENNNNINISSFTPVKNGSKIITKSYNLINTTIKETKKINNKYLEKNPSETKRGYSLDLSKIKYSDGYILTDAVNSNPGFGLWAIKGSSYNKINQSTNTIQTKTNKRLLIKENKINSSNNRYNPNDLTKTLNQQYVNNISTIKDINIININNITTSNKSLINSNNIDTNYNEKKKYNRKIIEQLKLKCKDLEQKCLNIMSNCHQKEFLYKNDIKIKKDYEKILQENLEETKLIKEEYKKILSDNNKLNNIYINAKDELNRLLNVMRTDNNNINKLREEFQNRLKNEEIERSRLKNVLNINEKEIESLRKNIYGTTESQYDNNEKLKQRNNLNSIMVNNKKSSKKSDVEIDNLNNVILELEIKISNLKKKLTRADEENNKLKAVIRFKGLNDEIEKNNINNLFQLLEYKTKNQKKELNTINEQNLFINNLKNNKDYIKRKNNLTKSTSLKKVKNYNKYY